MMGLLLCPISIKDANRFVDRHHRHHDPSGNHLFAVAVAQQGADEPCGAAIIALPVARALNDGWTAEVVRCCTNGEKNACSKLYAAAWRACRALGYRRLLTYTLSGEGGASLRAAGYRLVGEAGGGSWSCPSRPRVDHHPLQGKLRWERKAGDGKATK